MLKITMMRIIKSKINSQQKLKKNNSFEFNVNILFPSSMLNKETHYVQLNYLPIIFF